MRTTPSDRLSVALFCGSFQLGGSERNVVKIASGLDSSRFSVQVIALSREGPLRHVLERRGIPIVATDYSYDPRQHHIDQTRIANSIAGVAPHVVHAFNYPAIYFGVANAVRSGVPVRIVAIQAQDTWKGWIEWIMDRLIRPAVTLYIADGEGARQFAVRQQALPHDRVRCLYDGADLDELAPSEPPGVVRERLGILPGRKAVGVVARLADRHKGQSVFLRAVAQISTASPAQFLLVGDGGDEGMLRALARELGVADRVLFTGSQAELGDVLRALDILVIPSRQFESVPKILVEGMATGRPLIASRVGDIPEIVENEVTGLLVPPEDPPSLCEAILRLLETPGLAEKLGTAARTALIARGLTMQQSVQAMSRIYEELRLTSEPPSRLLNMRMQMALHCYRHLRLFDERVRWLRDACRSAHAS